jgi:ATP synthase subunit 10
LRHPNVRVLRACLGSLLVFSGLGWCADPFPLVEGDNLLGQKVAIPESTKGHPTVVVVGFTHASQAQTKVWSAQLDPEFRTYSLAVLQDVPRLVRGMAIHGIKSSVPEKQHDRFLLVLRGEKELKQAVGFDAPNDAYLALLDRDGLIQWQFHGPFTESVLAELKTRLVELEGSR